MGNILSGYNSTALAYGVTGSGKTHTMFGDIYMNLNFEKGICMYAVDHLFAKIHKESVDLTDLSGNSDLLPDLPDLSQKSKSYKVKISYLEIYNEQVVDLLCDRDKLDKLDKLDKRDKESPPDHLMNLMIIDDPIKGTMVPELTEYSVFSSEQVGNLIILGNSRRTMASTSLNQFSSRSHAILQINLEQKIRSKDNLNKEEIVTSKLLLVDLAGSERGGLEKGIRREEGANINKSLLALGNCINTLSDKSKKGSFVPYRDSKLTRLLKDSLGGNILTIMIACISPSILSYDETINTLKYASRARKIQKKVTRNIREEDLILNYPVKDDLVDCLKNEIGNLNEIIKNQNILLRSLPIESFKDDRDLINLNLNLNLNINKNNKSNGHDKKYSEIVNFCPKTLKYVNGLRKDSSCGIRTHSNSVSPKKTIKFENFGNINQEEFLSKNINLLFKFSIFNFL